MGSVEDRDIELPSGKVVLMSGVPVGASSAAIKDQILRQGLATAADFVIEPKQPIAPVEDPSMMDSVGNFLKKNMDIPGGIAGGITGATAGGLVAGPVGAIVGGIGGGALGSAGGSIASDVIAENPIDLEKAGREGAFSVGMDVATLGLFKAAKPVAKILGFGEKELASVAAHIINPVQEALVAGTQASKQATQALLEKGGGSLSAFQTGAASSFRRVSESIGGMGLFSSSIGETRKLANVNALRDETQRFLDGSLGQLDATASNVGETLHGLVDGARTAAISGYGKELDTLTTSLNKAAFSTKPITDAYRKFLRSNVTMTKQTVDEFGTKVTTPIQYRLDAGAINLLKEQGNLLKDAKMINADALIAFEKKVNNLIADAGNVASPNYKTGAQADLFEVSRLIRETNESVLGQIDPAGLAKYRELNATYSSTMEGLLPRLTKNTIQRGNAGAYTGIGEIATSSGRVNDVKALMGSIDTAFAVMKREGTPITGAVKTAEQAKELIRQGYLTKIFGDVSGEFDPSKFSTLARRLEKDADKAKLVMGKEYPAYKQLLNAMEEATIDPQGGFGSLVLRGREAQSLSNAAHIAAAGAAGAATMASVGTGAVGAFAIFGIPIVMAKVAGNPKAIRKLLALNSASKAKSGAELAAFLTSNVGKVIDELSTEDMRDIRIAIRDTMPAEQQQQ